jgi:hypothetical protein
MAAGCGLALVLVGCWCGLLARSAFIVVQQVDQLRVDLAAADAATTDLNALRARLSDLHTEVAGLRQLAAPLLSAAPYLDWLPGIGNDVQAAPALVDAVVDLLDAGRSMLDAVVPLWPPRSADGESGLAAAARSLAHLSQQTGTARQAVERAAGRLNSIDVERLSPALGRQVGRLSSLLPLALSGFDALDRAPALLGFDGPRTYLVLMQNDDELRPTGGFISAAARVTLDHGEITALDVRDSYQVDDFLNKPYDLPPQPLQDFMGSELWLFRDANWSPDFPTSARKAAELYAYGQGVAVDGVIAIDQKGVQTLFGALGPIEVEAGRPPVDASNLVEYMRAGWSPPAGAVDFGAWITSRKDFINKLMNAALARVQASPEDVDWQAVGRAALQALAERDVLVWIDDASVSPLLSRLGWDGAVKQVAGDYWMVVDANLGFNKVNAVVDSSIAYTLTLQPDGSADAEMTIHYRHAGAPAAGCVHQIEYSLALSYEALVQSCYWDYVRLYVPQQAQLRAMSSHSVPAEYLVGKRAFAGDAFVEQELGKTVFSTLFVLERGSALDVNVSYSLPSPISWDANGGRYSLTVQKQPGAKSYPVTVALKWPAGYALSESSLPPSESSSDSAEFSFMLETDRDLSVAWVGDRLQSR